MTSALLYRSSWDLRHTVMPCHTHSTLQWQIIHGAIQSALHGRHGSALTTAITRLMHRVNTTNIVASGNGAMGVESWNSSAFKCMQTISGLPEGYYHIATNSMYRYNTNKNNTNQSAQTAHTDGSE